MTMTCQNSTTVDVWKCVFFEVQPGYSTLMLSIAVPRPSIKKSSVDQAFAKPLRSKVKKGYLYRKAAALEGSTLAWPLKYALRGGNSES